MTQGLDVSLAVSPPNLSDDLGTSTRAIPALGPLLDADAIQVRDLADRITFWNPGCEGLYGLPRGAALAQDAHALLETRFPTPIEEIKAQLLTEGRWEGEVTRTTADGTEVVVAARWALRRDASGAPVEILEIGRDITAARRAEENIRRSEYRFRNVFQAMAVSFWELDFSQLAVTLAELRAQGIKDLNAHIAQNPGFVREMMRQSQVVDVNEKSLQLFGGTREDLLGPVDRFWPRSSEAVFAASVVAAVTRQSHYEAEAKFRKLDGSEFDALFTCCYPREHLPRGATLVGIIDITDRLRAQDALQKAQAELAHAARVSTLGELTASIAHEVNQPLAAIVTNGEASLRWLGRTEPDLDEARAAIQRMIDEGQRASDIISRIRAMSTKSAPEMADVPVGATIEDVTPLVRRELARHDVVLRLALAPDLPVIRGDRVQLQQVLINLMVNAIQAMEQPGVSRRDLTVRAGVQDGAVLVEVVDTGPGVPAERAGQLFNAFYTTKATGMGMGLSICKSIVEAHGGRIWVDPAEGGGSAFRFTLPVPTTA
ncbi:MAG: PAS domain S-box protein [Caulobacter sp.]|nr:PAS domain S-box protein [Caulobacter sp.]